MGSLFNALHTSIDAGAVILIAAMGSLLAERSGMLNLGMEGMMALGAVAAVVAAGQLTSPLLCLLVGIAAGALCGLVFGVVTAVIRANQVLTGLALVLLGVGLANRIGTDFAGTPMSTTFSSWPIPLLHEIPYIGRALFSHDPIVYVAYLVLPAAASYVLFRTRHGLNVRAIGENAAAADAAGLRVTATRTIYATIGGALAGMAGGWLVLSLTPTWTQNVTGGRGWVAIALVIFAYWRPWRVVGGALLFGGMISLGFLAQDQNWGIPAPVLAMLPYVLTLVLIVLPAFVPSIRARRAGAAPAGLTLPFYREAR
ncbi:MAG: ABC transporter permease [Solirubrobacteraceae bacterium]|nr:ABC transporter permease [Solirubrobacteraceae bacterium]